RNTAYSSNAVLDLYDFLIGHRLILDEDTYAFYRGEIDGPLIQVQPELLGRLRSREQQLNSIATLLHAPNAIVSMTPLGSTSAQAAHVWTMSNVRALLEQSLGDPGPWSGVGVRLVEDAAVPAGA